MPVTLRAVPPPARRCRGAPGRATRILRVLFRTARSKAPSPQPSPRLRRGEGAEQSAARTSPFGLSALQLFSFRRRAAVAHRVRARMARCSTRGPCAAVSWGRQARRGVDRDVDSFSPGQDALSKSPAPAHGLAGHGCPASAKWGVVFSWLLLFWTSKRASDSPSAGGRKLFAGMRHTGARASRLKLLLESILRGDGERKEVGLRFGRSLPC